MKTFLILENSQHDYGVLERTILKIDSEIKIEHFTHASELYKWIKLQVEEKRNNEGFVSPQVLCVISDYQLLENISLGLLDKIQKMFIHEGFTDEKKPCGFVITAFENVDFNLNDFIHPNIYNILYKPFDALLTEISLKIAIKGRGRIEHDLFTYQTKAEIEILKDIKTTAITELGFRTESAREIALGKKARYYSSILDSENLSYFFAYCTKNKSVKNEENKFISSFSYFGTSKRHLSAIRRFVRSHDDHKELPLENNEAKVSPRQFIFISAEVDNYSTFKGHIDENYLDVEIKYYSQPFGFYESLDKSLLDGSDHTGYVDMLPVRNEIVLELNKTKTRILNIYEGDKPFSDSDQFFNKSLKEIKEDDNFVKFLFNKKDGVKVIQFMHTPVKNTIILSISDMEKTQVDLVDCSESINADGDTVFEFKIKQHVADASEGRMTTNFSRVDAIFVDKSYISEQGFSTFRNMMKTLKTQFEHLRFIVVSETPIKSYEHLQKHIEFDDYIALPFDSFYLVRTLKQMIPHLVQKGKNYLSREGIEYEVVIQTALPVSISQISECHVSLSYTRALKVGDVRRFVLFDANIENLPEIWGMCNHTDKVSDGEYRNDFIFFALKDVHLSFIRQWIKKNYIEAKNKS